MLRRLVERPGELVSKDALIEAAWPSQIVEENNLTVQIAALRRVLGTSSNGSSWIETLPRRGYRFVGSVVTEVQEAAVEAPPPADATPKTTPGPDAERRQVSAMSCELVGASGSTGNADPKDQLKRSRFFGTAFQRLSVAMADKSSAISAAPRSSCLVTPRRMRTMPRGWSEQGSNCVAPSEP
jgi:DNA-binding winged helix-turn-helix (wHTH) protein